MANIIGQILLNQYRVDEFIASGGMGAVYKVWDLKRNVPLAMKVLHADFVDDPSSFKYFQREARALQKLRHPHVVPFYGLYQDGNTAFLLEHYVDGPSLRDILQNYKNGLPIPETLTYMQALCSALGYAHSSGVVHCDIKPGNVMIDRGGQIYLADFGIARHSESTTTTTIAGAGTPAYMSPEQIRGESVTASTDVYALGVLFFEMLTGLRPFRGDESKTQGETTAERIRFAHLYLSPPDPRTHNPGVSPALVNIITKCLAKDPVSRYQTTHELMQELCQLNIPFEDRASIIPMRPKSSVSTVIVGKEKSKLSNEAKQTVKETIYHKGKKENRATLWGGIAALFAIGIYVLSSILYARSPHLGQPSEDVLSSPTFIFADSPHVATDAPESTPMLVPPSGTPSLKPLPLISEPSQTPTESAASWRQGKLIFMAKYQGAHAIYLMDMKNGGDFAELIFPPVKNFGDYQGTHLSPDGSKILFYMPDRGSWALDDLANRQPRNLSACTTPSWSPDGSQVVCRQGLSLQIIDAQTGDIAKGIGVNGSLPAWSPMGNEIAYVVWNGSQTNIWRVDIQSGENVLLAGNANENYAPSWSPDGQWIAYQSDSNSTSSQIWTMDRNGANARQITNLGNWSRVPAWSPDGNWLAFVSDANGSIGVDYGEVFLISLVTAETLQLTEMAGSVYDWRVSWSR